MKHITELFDTTINDDLIYIVGLGESSDGFLTTHPTMGVNDVYKKYQTDYLVVVDTENRFTEERRKIIYQSNPVYFFTQFENQWDMIPNKYLFTLGSKDLTNFPNTEGVIDYSVLSPYMCVILAYYLGYRDIRLIGVDLHNHNQLDNTTMLKRINDDFKKLYTTLQQKNCNVWNCSKNSLVTTLPYHELT